MKESKTQRELRIKIPEDLYTQLENQARREGFASIEEYILSILTSSIRGRIQVDELEKLKSRLERYIQDELNKNLAVIENLKRQVIEIYEKIEDLDQRVKNLEESIKKIHEEKPREAITPRKTGIERLREEKVLFESKLPPRIQRDRLFAYFERMGAIIIKLSKERIAVDPDYWREFKEKLNEISTNKEEEIASILGSPGYELWRALYLDNAIYFDPKSKKWRFVEESNG